jgi:hypothetical protein
MIFLPILPYTLAFLASALPCATGVFQGAGRARRRERGSGRAGRAPGAVALGPSCPTPDRPGRPGPPTHLAQRDLGAAAAHLRGAAGAGRGGGASAGPADCRTPRRCVAAGGRQSAPRGTEATQPPPPPPPPPHLHRRRVAVRPCRRDGRGEQRRERRARHEAAARAAAQARRARARRRLGGCPQHGNHRWAARLLWTRRGEQCGLAPVGCGQRGAAAAAGGLGMDRGMSSRQRRCLFADRARQRGRPRGGRPGGSARAPRPPPSLALSILPRLQESIPSPSLRRARSR